MVVILEIKIAVTVVAVAVIVAGVAAVAVAAVVAASVMEQHPTLQKELILQRPRFCRLRSVWT